MTYSFNYSDILTINVGLKKILKSGKEFPLLVSKTLFEDLEKTNTIIKEQNTKIIELRKNYGEYDEINNEYIISKDNIGEFNEEYNKLLNLNFGGIEKIYIKDVRYDEELKRTNLSLEAMEHLKFLIE
jgi:hypothetical protein